VTRFQFLLLLIGLVLVALTLLPPRRDWLSEIGTGGFLPRDDLIQLNER
jgi:hypothetical protein